MNIYDQRKILRIKPSAYKVANQCIREFIHEGEYALALRAIVVYPIMILAILVMLRKEKMGL